MNNSEAAPVIAGLAMGIALVLFFALLFHNIIQAYPTPRLGIGNYQSLTNLIVPIGKSWQVNEDNTTGIVETHVPAEFQPWLGPAFGEPHLYITEMAISDPGGPIKVRYDHEVWLHRAMDKRGNLAKIDPSIDIGQEIRIGTVIRLDDAEKEAYYDVYKEARTNTSSFDVIFPNGLVKYYSIYFLEII